jgi:hypothetical protein
MAYLPLILSTACALAAIYAAYRAIAAEHAADHTAKRLAESRGRLIANEVAIEELAARVRSFNGRLSQAISPSRPRENGADEMHQTELIPLGSQVDDEFARTLALQRAEPVRRG